MREKTLKQVFRFSVDFSDYLATVLKLGIGAESSSTILYKY